MNRDWIKALIEHEPLAKYTSWRIGGPARYLANVAGPAELRAALAWAGERGLPVFLLGGGTNVLVRDAGWPGLVVRYRAQELLVEPHGERALARVGAGAPMAGTARRLARQGWAGLEWAEGLPGTIGGALFGNAGCYGGDIASVLERAWLLVGDAEEEWPVERFGYGYRTSVLKPTNDQRPTTNERQPATERGQDQPSFVARRSSLVAHPIIIEAEFRLTRADPRELAERMERTAAERKRKTPWGSSCGSVFKNPPGDSAGRLIEAAGLKGARRGAAEIAQKHANYIVNLGGASSDDVLRLVELARETVLHRFGVELELEVQVI
ncbi:MAG TPA: UDP-N-acetylmuramate dehydrogenase [Roseiflexaceae bacterium]|nr:UDP-N-acetylmuramate dehydrogenase [Roseiflexaceae bacterium]